MSRGCRPTAREEAAARHGSKPADGGLSPGAPGPSVWFDEGVGEVLARPRSPRIVVTPHRASPQAYPEGILNPGIVVPVRFAGIGFEWQEPGGHSRPSTGD